MVNDIDRTNRTQSESQDEIEHDATILHGRAVKVRNLFRKKIKYYRRHQVATNLDNLFSDSSSIVEKMKKRRLEYKIPIKLFHRFEYCARVAYMFKPIS